MIDLVFATHNRNKLEELRVLVGDHINLLGLSDIGCDEDIAETADSLEGNALIKARFVKEKYGYDCFSDDTGLEVYALNGAPGVYSARYAGEQANADANINKLLRELAGATDRGARFRTVIALTLSGEEYLFEGEVGGIILTTRQGEGGFGYDPIFQPEGESVSFAEMEIKEKSKISHRGRAIAKLLQFLKEK